MLKITRINRKGQEAETLIKVEDIVGVFEEPQEETKLYNEEGELVETKPNESLFKVCFTNDTKIRIKKSEYDKLQKHLTIETL